MPMVVGAVSAPKSESDGRKIASTLSYNLLANGKKCTTHFFPFYVPDNQLVISLFVSKGNYTFATRKTKENNKYV